ncbi:hypothetical protein OBBRIDRAFT_624304 [Obba rivulosa]|uniref:Transmembrane protein n=1 Tax=Obba rivulosa TaxID=1052685 RepID=A0A8E2DNK3_9APHY|nr:hypothetical protein OBBRIDRAFT_624304 [Obba rivulosa]
MWYQIDTLPVVGVTCSDGSKLSETENVRACVIAADLLVLVVTWSKTYGILRDTRLSKMRPSIAIMLLRDGTLYFLLLLTLNILNIAGFSSHFFDSAIALFGTPLSSMIISHFLLNLRQAANAPQDDNLDTLNPSFIRSRTSSIKFGAFVDNMGADLVHDSDLSVRDFSISRTKDTDSDAFSQIIVSAKCDPKRDSIAPQDSGLMARDIEQNATFIEPGIGQDGVVQLPMPSGDGLSEHSEVCIMREELVKQSYEGNGTRGESVHAI